MTRKNIILITLCFLLGIGLVSGLLIPKNTPIIAHFLNKNTIEVEVEGDLDKEKIEIRLSIRGTEFDDIKIYNKDSVNTIPKAYGENEWFISYDEKNYGVFRHFKTNNWHDHHYSFVFYKKDEQVFCDVQITGPDQMDKRTIRLDKRMKTDVGSEIYKGDTLKVIPEKTEYENFKVAYLEYHKESLQRVFIVIDSANIYNTAMIQSIICELRALFDVDKKSDISFFSEKKYADYKTTLFIDEGHPFPIEEYENWMNYFYLAEYELETNEYKTYPSCRTNQNRQRTISIGCE